MQTDAQKDPAVFPDAVHARQLINQVWLDKIVLRADSGSGPYVNGMTNCILMIFCILAYTFLLMFLCCCLIMSSYALCNVGG